MKPRLCILLNSYNEIESVKILEKYLPPDRFSVTLACEFPSDYKKYHLIAPLNYRKLIKEADFAENVIIFHTSNLPEGKGWAPIYYTLSEEKKEYVVTGIKAAADVDAGEVVIRARFDIIPNYTASFLRKIDEHLFFLLIAKLLETWPSGDFQSIAQKGSGSYRSRRNASDNEIDISLPFVNLIPHLRAVESQHPAYFIYDGEKYLISIDPENATRFPKKVLIEYEAIGKSEIWEGWS